MNKKILCVVAVAAIACNSSVFAAAKASSQHKKNKQTSANTASVRTQSLEKDVQSLKAQVADLQQAKEKGRAIIGSLAEVYAHGPALVTSPSLGVRRSAEDPYDLMVMLSSMNEDLQILRVRKKMDNYAVQNGIDIPERPIIAVSGGLEGQVPFSRDYTGKKTLDVDLTKAELDFVGEASPWATGTMILSYDNGGINGVPNRVMNSRLTLSRGFMTIGQLNKSPVYFTMGQVYLPFGKYSNNRTTTPSTQVLGRIKQRAAILGFEYAGIYGQAYGFPGETHVDGNIQLAERGGLNLGYKRVFDGLDFDIGAGVTGNIAESQGMQSNGMSSPYFAGFDINKTLKSRVPGVDGYAKASYDNFTVISEYVAATKAFDAVDMTFNGKGAKPSALDAELAYNFKVWSKPNAFTVGYGQTWQSLAINVPQRDFFAAYNVSLFKDTIQTLEFRHSINYASTDSATGNSAGDLTVVQQTIYPNGKISNKVTFELGVYF